MNKKVYVKPTTKEVLLMSSVHFLAGSVSGSGDASDLGYGGRGGEGDEADSRRGRGFFDDDDY